MILLFLTVSLCHWVMAGGGLRIAGKIRSVKPTEVRLETLGGAVLLQAELKGSGEFSMGPVDVQPDVYVLRIGNLRACYYLENGEIGIKGFFDERDHTKNRLTLSGIERHNDLLKWIPSKQDMNNLAREFAPEMFLELTPVMCGAVAFLSSVTEHGPNARVLAMFGKSEQKTGIGQWLAHRVDSLKHIAIGARVPDCPFVDVNGNTRSFRDFRGKYVLVDFWASWCGPCRREMQTLLPIYEDLKGEDLVFVSVSLDDRRENWVKMMEEEDLPWTMLWNEKGFSKRAEAPNEVQRAYGFLQIPFIMLLDKKGRIVCRHLRGEAVREAILKLRNHK